MYNHQLFSSVFRATNVFSGPSALMATAKRPPFYENNRVRLRKYKSLAKLSRKLKKAGAMAGSKNPRDFGEEMPPYFLQPRYKLMYKVL
jgi:hypothetical protein